MAHISFNHLNNTEFNRFIPDAKKKQNRMRLIISLLIVGVLLMLLSLNNCSPKEPALSPADNYIKEQIKLIGEQNLALQIKIDSLSLKVKQYNIKLDKLSKSKTEIRYIYENKLTEIDNLYTSGIIKEFSIIFSKSNIK
jgi:hypothetical protein